jgi:multimeric flavodoxin WrbA
MQQEVSKTIKYLKKKKKVLFLTTSNRWIGEKEKPKSTLLAYKLAQLCCNVKIMEVPSLTIFHCEGNVSTQNGNNCGVKKALLKDKQKNPSNFHRCWASLNNKTDELWKISKLLFESDVVVFFTSVRWGQTNSIYQKLIERLTWIENRHTSLKEKNIIKNISAGIIVVGQNWNGENVVKIERKVLEYFGFKTPKELSWNWQYTKNLNDESQTSYKKAFPKFKKLFLS